MKGAFSTVWFDRYKISNDCPEHIESIDSMCWGLTDLINDEIKNGIAKDRILIGKTSNVFSKRSSTFNLLHPEGS